MTKLYIVVPCYNEQEVLEETAKRLREKYESLMADGRITKDSKIVFVNDGSKDNTWSIISKLSAENEIFGGICLSRNRGHQNALLAGLMSVRTYADCVISMDADLQDDINAVDGMLEKFEEGNDIVYGVRSRRATDTFFKRFTAEGFYKLVNAMGAEVVFNHADYRLMSARAIEGLAQFDEVNLFLRGIIPMIGYKSDIVYYERAERFAGESKYPLKKMLAFAWEGITSFSVTPLKFTFLFAVLSFVASFGMTVFSIVSAILGYGAPLWATVGLQIWLAVGIVLLAIGILGEYLGKVYREVKHRPSFLISQTVGLKDAEKS